MTCILPGRSEDCSPIGLAQTSRRLEQRVEYFRKIERRTADDLDHIGSRRLLLQRLSEFARPSLLCLKQPHIFYSDHCLISESLDQLDLLVSERPRFRAQQSY